MKEQPIRVDYRTDKKTKPIIEDIEFGREFTDHMFVMDYSFAHGWHDPRIIPYQPLTVDPAAMIFHYGQSVFEGMKAYLSPKGDALLFRPQKNIERLNRSNQRLCIPEIDEKFVLKAIKQLVSLEKEWIPTKQGTSLYIRPFIISTEPYLGVASSQQYQFIVILSPVGSYYKEGVNPVEILVENEYVRAVVGGTGEAKTGGNYASSLKAQEIAERNGYAQVLWLDAVEKKYIEEVGSMNVFFKINGEIITPALTGSILPGVTRDSAIKLLKHWGFKVTESKITIKELIEAFHNGILEEAFGTGTAAVISPIGSLVWNDEKITINQGKTGELSKRLYDTITDIQYGKTKDPFGWSEYVDKALIK